MALTELITDCSTGKQVFRKLTANEEGARLTEGAASAAADLATTQTHAADLAIVTAKAKTDPAFAALARLVGIA